MRYVIRYTCDCGHGGFCEEEADGIDGAEVKWAERFMTPPYWILSIEPAASFESRGPLEKDGARDAKGASFDSSIQGEK